MKLEGLVFVTSNLGKLEEARAILGLPLKHQALKLPEIQSLDLEAIVRHKARAAHERLGVPVLVEDTALELAGLGGFPGPLVRWLLATVGPTGIARIAHAFGDPRARARCLACATDGETEVFGLGEVRGTIAESPRGSEGFGWDSVFIPDGCGGRTYAEMEPAEKNRVSHRRKALLALRERLNAGGTWAMVRTPP